MIIPTTRHEILAEMERLAHAWHASKDRTVKAELSDRWGELGIKIERMNNIDERAALQG